MCRACNESFPAVEDFLRLRNAARGVRTQVAHGGLLIDGAEFIAAIVELDTMRFNAPPFESSPEWGHAGSRDFTNRLLFRADPARALTLFVLACWFDARESYAKVWSSRLEELAAWIASPTKSKDTLPSTRSGPWTQYSAWRTWSAAMKADSVATLPRWSTLLLLLIPKARATLGGFSHVSRKTSTTPSQANRDALRSLRAGSFRVVL